jgi:hypothetical protein
MLATRRWRDWQSGEVSQKRPECEPAKPSQMPNGGFLQVLQAPCVRVPKKCNALDAALTYDPAEWRAPFVQWVTSACTYHPRVFGSVSKLHLAFCEWEITNGGVPCTRETLVCLLQELEFLVGEINGVLLVSGLTFLDDVQSVFPKSIER